MLYRATGRLLCHLLPGAGPMPLIRDRRRAEASPKPVKPARSQPGPIPARAEAEQDRWSMVRPNRRPRILDPRWTRISYWWIFPTDRLNQMVEAL